MDAQERPSAVLILGSTEGAKKQTPLHKDVRLPKIEDKHEQPRLA
jgi:hypothetical protein